MQSSLFKLKGGDFLKGLVFAIVAGFVLPVLIALQSPGFSLATVNWHQVFQLAETGAITGFSSYIIHTFFSDEQGRVFGKIG